MVMALEAALVVVIGMHVDVFGLELVVEDALAGVEARISGEHERQAAAEREEDDPASAEELEREQEKGRLRADLDLDLFYGTRSAWISLQ